MTLGPSEQIIFLKQVAVVVIVVVVVVVVVVAAAVVIVVFVKASITKNSQTVLAKIET